MSIIIAAMLPIFTLERVEGRIFRPMALTYAFALGGALLFTLTAVPALTTVLLRRTVVSEKEPGFLVLLRRVYLRGLRVALTWPITTRLAALVVLAVAIFLIPRLGTEFLPQMNEGDIHITVTMPSAVSLKRGGEILLDIRKTLRTFQEVQDVVNEQGHPEDGTDDEAPNQAETFVILKPEKDWTTGRDKEQLVAAMRA
jgi:cobalt-zinc-cadmium resistance protein CzcA